MSLRSLKSFAAETVIDDNDLLKKYEKIVPDEVHDLLVEEFRVKHSQKYKNVLRYFKPFDELWAEEDSDENEIQKISEVIEHIHNKTERQIEEYVAAFGAYHGNSYEPKNENYARMVKCAAKYNEVHVYLPPYFASAVTLLNCCGQVIILHSGPIRYTSGLCSEIAAYAARNNIDPHASVITLRGWVNWIGDPIPSNDTQDSVRCCRIFEIRT